MAKKISSKENSEPQKENISLQKVEGVVEAEITKELETYGIVGQPDAYEGYKTDITLNCYSVLDSNDYTGEAYDE